MQINKQINKLAFMCIAKITETSSGLTTLLVSYNHSLSLWNNLSNLSNLSNLCH